MLLGLDIGGKTTKAILCDRAGKILADTTWPSTPPYGGDAAAWSLAQARLWMTDTPAAIGIAICGLIDQTRGTMVHAPNARGLQNWGYRDLYAAHFECPVALLNDAKAFVFAESRCGAGMGYAHLLGLTLGTGIGGGLILNGALYLGAHGWLGEIGHIPLDPEGPYCLCGLRGCLEAYLREEAFVRHYNASVTDPRTAVKSGEAIVERAALGDPDALAVWSFYGTKLGEAIGGAVTLLDLEAVVLGGGLAAGYDYFIESLEDRMNEWVSRPEERAIVLRQAQLGRHAGAIGAALFAAASNSAD